MTAATTAARRAGTGRRGMALMIAAGFLVVLFASATKNTVSALFVPMADDFAASRGAFALAPSLFMFTYAVASPVMGHLADRYGAKATMVAGVAGTGVLFALLARTTSLPAFVALYGVGLAFAFTAVSYVPLGVLVDEVFPPGRRGVVYALFSNGTAVGFILLSPLWIGLGDGHSWRGIYLALGAIMLVLAVIAARVLPDRDAAGGRRAEPAAGPPPPAGGPRSVFRSRVFWLVSLAFVSCGTTMGYLDVHLVAHLHERRLGDAAVSLALALFGGTAIVGAMIAGRLSDLGRTWQVLAGSYLLRAVSLLLLLVLPGAAGSWVFAVLFGMSYMGTVVAGSLCLLEEFHGRNRGFALGLMWFAHQVGAIAASQAGGFGFDRLHSYDPVVLVAAASTAAAFLLIRMAGGPATRAVRRPAG